MFQSLSQVNAVKGVKLACTCAYACEDGHFCENDGNVKDENQDSDFED